MSKQPTPRGGRPIRAVRDERGMRIAELVIALAAVVAAVVLGNR
jgi:hypothetical protein